MLKVVGIAIGDYLRRQEDEGYVRIGPVLVEGVLKAGTTLIHDTDVAFAETMLALSLKLLDGFSARLACFSNAHGGRNRTVDCVCCPRCILSARLGCKEHLDNLKRQGV